MQHVYHRCPVTALAACHDDLLLAGEGNYLNVYQIRHDRRRESIKVFESQAVHGIVLSADRRCIVVWGGRLIRLLIHAPCSQGFTLDLSEVLSVDDWILDAAFAFDRVRHTAGLVTAHNALWTITFEEQCNEDTVRSSDWPIKAALERGVSGSNCILYSAHVKWISVSHCLIASGTAFGDVILWSAFFDKERATRAEVHFTFPAHEGSVFGMQISSPMKLPENEEERRLLASCSDDRTIRLWDISDLDARSPTLTEIQRETGFGSQSTNAAHAPPLLARVMGHASRIWHVRFLPDKVHTQHTGPKILSGGEDASANTWHLAANPPSAPWPSVPYKLELLDARSSHNGKNIWSVTQGPRFLATGGADGAISDDRTPFQEDGMRNWLPHTGDLNPGDNFKAYAFVSDGLISTELISTTEHGRIMGIRMDDGLHKPIQEVRELSAPLSGLRGYSVITSLDRTAYISGTDGTIYCYAPSETSADASRLLKLAQRPGKTAGLFVCRLVARSVCLLATGIGSAPASLYVLRSTRGDWPPFEHDGLDEYRLAIPAGVTVTSFAALRVQPLSIDVFVGSRLGSILIYRIAGRPSIDPVHPVNTRDLTHGKEAVTGLATVLNGWDDKFYLISSGRDGTVAIHRFEGQVEPPSLKLVHQLSLPLGPNIEGVSVDYDDETLRVWGFRGKHFVYYNVTDHQEIMSVECGGAHRNWTLSFHHSNYDRCLFVWTKASKVHYYLQHQSLGGSINSGGHGREIKAMAVSGRLTHGKEIIATGAEDTDLKLFLLCTMQEDGRGGWLEQPHFECLHTLRKHNTGIQHLAWDGEYLFSSGGFEEFFVWKVYPNVPCFEVGVVCESTHPRSGKSDLRICGFDVRRLSREDEVAFEISMAYSDSTLKVWRYVDGIWDMLRGGDYLTSCLTHVLPDPVQDGVIITASTDGHLARWQTLNSETSLSWNERHKVHQSAIHAFASSRLPGSSTLIATGGDDNALALSRLTADGTLRTLLISRAHAAAVTGLALIPRRSSDNRQHFWLVSASLDQRIKLWRISVDGSKQGIDGVEVEKVQSVFTSIADVSGLEECTLGEETKAVLACGVGMDVWRLPQDGSEDVEDENHAESEGKQDG